LPGSEKLEIIGNHRNNKFSISIQISVVLLLALFRLTNILDRLVPCRGIRIIRSGVKKIVNCLQYRVLPQLSDAARSISNLVRLSSYKSQITQKAKMKFQYFICFPGSKSLANRAEKISAIL